MEKIVACVDGATYTESVCDYASWSAQRLQVPLEFLHVLMRMPEHRLDASGSIGLGAQEALLAELSQLDERRSILAREHGRRILQAVRDRAVEFGIADVDVRQGHDDLIDTLLDLQDDTRLFVMGQHDEAHKPKRFLLDHNLESAIRALNRPILVAGAEFCTPSHFMIAFDGSATGRKMVERVASSPLLRGLECSVVMAGGEATALQWAQDVLAQASFEVKATLLQGDPVETLLNYAEHASIDMLVMGAYGHSRIREWVVGSTTTAILRRANRPIFILP